MVQSMTLGDTYSSGSHLINSLHLTWNRERLSRGPATNLPSAGSLGINIGPAPGDFPEITVGSDFSVSCDVCAHAFVNRNSSRGRDDVSWVHGRHQIGFGGEYARLQMNFRFATLSTGTYSFDGSFTGDALADYLLGDTVSFSQGSAEAWSGRDNRLGMYVQDSFHASPRLTLLAGFRWEPYFPAFDPKGRGGAHFVPAGFTVGEQSREFLNAPPGMFYPGDNVPGFGVLPKAGTVSDLPDFAPRVGLAWDPTGSGRWSVRASYGILYDLPDLGFLGKNSDSAPWGDLIGVSSPSGGFASPYLSLPGGDPFPLPYSPPADVYFPPAGAYRTMPLHMDTPNSQQWNLSVDRQVGANLLLSASYIGNKSTHRWLNNEMNPAVYIPGTCGASNCSTIANTQARRVLSLDNPTAAALISGIGYADVGGNAEYNALYLSANHRLSEKFSVLANYTWSHCLSEGALNTESGGDNFQNPYNVDADRGNCVNDIRQLFNLSYIAISPHFKGPILEKFLGNWHQTGIMGKHTGNWLTPLDGRDISLTGVGQDRPNLIGIPHLSHPALQEWFNTFAFAEQAAGTYGDASTFSILGPGGFTFDAMLSREFRIRGGQHLEVRFEAFNVLNHPVFGNPETTLTSTSTYGQILSANDPRILQFAMKYVF